MSGDYPRRMMANHGPIGVVLAGGLGRRLGGAKATTPLAGRPLLAWPVEALGAALEEVVVAAKPATPLPALEVPVWVEPPEPVHPRAGLVCALRRAGGRAVLACAGDLPLVTPALVRALARAPAAGAPAVVPRAAGRLQPLLARYEPAALAPLAAAPPGEALIASVERLGPRVVELDDGEAFLNVNAPEDLAAAEQAIACRS
jgi:molybdopterin-guanine dinucleotide biosynthesis protein A